MKQLAINFVIGIAIGMVCEWLLIKWQAALLIEELEFDLAYHGYGFC